MKKQAAEAAEAAAEKERQRQRDEFAAKVKEQEAREADKKHHAAVNRAARDAIEKIIAVHVGGETHPIPGSCATAIVTALAKREIPHCKIEY